MGDEIESAAKKSFLHPASGGIILGADWLFFSGTVLSGGFGVLSAMPLGFLTGLVGVTCSQRFLAEENWGKAITKGILSGIVIGMPFPVFGTLVGGGVLAVSGLDEMRNRAAATLVEKTRRNKPPEALEKK